MQDRIVAAAGLGAVTGLRSMQGLAWVALELADGRLPRRAGRLERWLAKDAVAMAAAVMAAGELVADKLPGTPDRINAPSLLGRGLIGALVGAVAVGKPDRAVGAAVGAGAALVASFAGWMLRREAARATMLPDAAVALAEDAVAVAAARELAAQL